MTISWKDRLNIHIMSNTFSNIYTRCETFILYFSKKNNETLFF